MADPLSVGGLAVGVIGLGLQTCGGVLSYLEGLNTRKVEIDAAGCQVGRVRDLLRTVGDITGRVEASHGAAVVAVNASVASLEGEIKALDELVASLISSPAGGADGLRRRFQEKTKKLSYPFHRPSLVLLEERLHRVEGSLRTALQVLQT